MANAGDVARVDAQQHFGLIVQALEQTDLDVGVEAGQHPGGVVVVEQLAAELEACRGTARDAVRLRA